MKLYIGLLLITMASCNTVKYPAVSISKIEKQHIYLLVKDTLNKEWINETKSANWKVLYIKKFVNKNYTVKTSSSSLSYKGFFIIAFLDSSLHITSVGKEIKY